MFGNHNFTNGPTFEMNVPRNVTTAVGQTAFLHCRVHQLGDKEVRGFTCYFLSGVPFIQEGGGGITRKNDLAFHCCLIPPMQHVSSVNNNSFCDIKYIPFTFETTRIKIYIYFGILIFFEFPFQLIRLSIRSFIIFNLTSKN